MKSKKCFLLFIFVFSIKTITCETPIVLWHGMGMFFVFYNLKILINLFTYNFKVYIYLINKLIIVISNLLSYIGDTCCFPFSLGSVTKMLKLKLNNVYVKSLKIGHSLVDDYESGFFVHPNKQVYIILSFYLFIEILFKQN